MSIDWEAVGRSGKTLHPIRQAILEYLDKEGKGSPNQISEETGHPLGLVSYHMKVMLKYKEPWVATAGTRPRRGALEHFYKLASGAPMKDDEAEAA